MKSPGGPSPRNHNSKSNPKPKPVYKKNANKNPEIKSGPKNSGAKQEQRNYGKNFPAKNLQGKKRLDAPPSKLELGRLLTKYGVPLNEKILDKLWQYHQLLRANNGDQDLTRLIGFDTIAQRHYADCMILHGLMNGKWPSPLVDVGSGAGFPGIMIKLMSPETEIVLAEPRPRRVQFLEMVIKELGLKKISVFGHKVTSRSLTRPFAGAITRAFETIETTLPRYGGCLGMGGRAIFMKGPKVLEELKTFKNDEYKLIKNHAYTIPNTIQDRVLVILERIRVPAPGEAVKYDSAQEADIGAREE